MRKLVITIDDFGLTEGINTAVDKLLAKGSVRNISVMVNAPSFENAKGIIAKYYDTNISFGLHFNIYEGKPITDNEALKPLLDKNGNFLASLPKIIVAFKLNGNKLLNALECELKAQYDILAKSTKVSHIDVHKFLAFTPVIKITDKVAKEFNIPYIRIPLDPFVTDDLNFSRASISAYFVSLFAKRLLADIDSFSIPCAGINKIGCWQLKDMQQILLKGQYNTLEVVMHAGEVCEQLKNNRTRLKEHRKVEFDLLMSEDMSYFIKKHNWQIAGFNDL